jgi:hypothetical protein
MVKAQMLIVKSPNNHPRFASQSPLLISFSTHGLMGTAPNQE